MSHDAQTLSVYDARAAEYRERFVAEGPGRILTRFIAALPAQARVLDLGCGPGTASLHMRTAGHAPDPVDASPAMVKIATEAGLPARLASFDDLTAQAEYDGVWANFSLLHAPRRAFPQHLEAIKRALKPGGVFHLGMKLGKGESRDALGRFYSYYTRDELAQHLNQAGFDILAEEQFTEKGLAGTPDPGITLLTKATT